MVNGLRILEVGYSFASGGAAVMANMLAEDLAALGHQVSFAGIHPPPRATHAGWHGLGRVPAPGRFRARFERWSSLLRSPAKGWDVLSGREDFHCPDSRRILDLAADADVVHLHNLHGSPAWFDLRVLPELSRLRPVVATLHDAWLTSGHCSHSFACDRWHTGCGACPDLSIHPPLRRDGTAANWQAKSAILAATRLHVAAPSQWILERAQASLLAAGAASWSHLPHGVDGAMFHPGDRLAARRGCGLPLSTPVLLFAAEGVARNPFKDWKTLSAALRLIGETLAEPVLTLAVGQAAPGWKHGNMEVRFVPWLASPAGMAELYRTADIYVHAAKADTFPYTILESLACGTPVVASAVGGIPEQLGLAGEQGPLGRLTPVGDAKAMAQAILGLLGDAPARLKMGTLAAATMAGSMLRQRTSRSYLDLFACLAADQRPRSQRHAADTPHT
jgi:glycosyltransferase involved in cell wall biosynthesis